MEYSNEILKIVEGALKSDKAKVLSYTKLLVDKLKQNNENRIANSFSKIVNNNLSSMSQKSINDMVKVPLDQESRLPMADVLLPEQLADTQIVLNRSAREQVTKFLDYYDNTNKLVNAGIKVPNTVLLYGPPGCGKSKLANYICLKTKLPLVIARIDGLISSYLGSTAKNIRTIFEYAQTVPCVLFLDEFDALAKVRDDNNELGELKRVVNSLLQNIDQLQNGSIIVAATNHDQLLDPAVWRRFGFRILMEKPDTESIKQLVQCFIDKKFSEKELALFASSFNNLTGAEIEEICQKASIDSLILNEELDIKSVFDAYFDFKKVLDDIDNNETEKEINKRKAKFLRNIDSKVFSYNIISEILGVSKTYVSSMLKEREDN